VSVLSSQLSIAATLLSGASEQIADAAAYLERAGDQPGSQELHALNEKTLRAICKIEAKIQDAEATRRSQA
jgi:hypothetical protein